MVRSLRTDKSLGPVIDTQETLTESISVTWPHSGPAISYLFAHQMEHDTPQPPPPRASIKKRGGDSWCGGECRRKQSVEMADLLPAFSVKRRLNPALPSVV